MTKDKSKQDGRYEKFGIKKECDQHEDLKQYESEVSDKASKQVKV